MARDHDSKRQGDPPILDGDNPFFPPTYYLVLIGALALVIGATFL